MKTIKITSVLEIEPISDDINVKTFLRDSIKICQKLETSANLKINGFCMVVNDGSDVNHVYDEYLEMTEEIKD